VPSACRTRPANSGTNPGAAAPTTVPAKKRDIADNTICLVVNHCWSSAVTGTRTPMTSMYPVDSHWTVEDAMPNSRMSAG